MDAFQYSIKSYSNISPLKLAYREYLALDARPSGHNV